MTSKDSLRNKFDGKQYLSYMGISLGTGKTHIQEYVDIETFFLWGTTQFEDSRIAEGFLCWVLEYGDILSPSKIRNLVKSGANFNPHILNGVLVFMAKNEIKTSQLGILKQKGHFGHLEFSQGVRVRNPMPEFAEEGILLPRFKFNKNKFLRDRAAVIKNNVEIRSRLLFGSCVNADVYSALEKNPGLTRYDAHLLTHHYKASVNKIFDRINEARLPSPYSKEPKSPQG